MGGVAASGGYYIAAAADKIVANPGTITGSIGVIMEFILLEDLFSKIGINLEVLKSGEFKDIGSPHRKLTDRDRELINDLIADLQGQFVRAVSNGRDLPVLHKDYLADMDVILIGFGNTLTSTSSRTLTGLQIAWKRHFDKAGARCEFINW